MLTGDPITSSNVTAGEILLDRVIGTSPKQCNTVCLALQSSLFSRFESVINLNSLKMTKGGEEA